MSDSSFDTLRDSLLNLDPVYWAEKHLTLDGKPYRVFDSGYKPIADIMRYIGVKSMDESAKPVVWLKSRQISGTVTSSVIEMFFMASGLFGTETTPPMRVAHVFPYLDHAAAFSKTKLSAMIDNSILVDDPSGKKGKKPILRTLIDSSSATNDNLQFKQFKGGNHIWIESAGLEGNRLRGKTIDALFMDECLPYDQCIEVNNGKMQIGQIYNKFIKNEELPSVKTFNEKTKKFEFKKITKAWKRDKSSVMAISCGNRKIRCTPNHRFLTENHGWLRADELKEGMLLKMSPGTDLHVRSLNDDQFQVTLGSFLGDGHLDNFKLNRYRIAFTHGIDQLDYVNWKASLFNVENIRFIEKNGYSEKPALAFATKIFGIENNFPHFKDSCPQWILDSIDARGIAIWFMDDGSTNCWGENATATLHTSSFDEDSHIRFVKKFKSLDIDCHYKLYEKKKSGKSYYRLIFNKDGCKKLFKLIEPYMHENLSYKIINYDKKTSNYKWNCNYNEQSLTVVDKIKFNNKIVEVYDIEVEDNHNFIVTPSRKSPNIGGPILHNCQDIPAAAIANSIKTLTKSNYGPKGNGIQVYFGTPKQKGSDFFRMWQQSSQQFYYLGCEGCKDVFPLYTPGSNEWETIWLRENIVKCTHCGCEQDRLQAINRGKWVATKDPAEAKFVGFHLNRLYLPEFTKEKILNEKPGNSAINTERAYQNEVLGEFFQGEAGIITSEEIREKCGDPERKFRGNIAPGEEIMTFLGIDIGAKADLEQLVNSDKIKTQGQSYSTAVVLSVTGPGRLSIEYAFKFKKNDLASKKSILDETIKRYRTKLAICDIGYAHDFNEIMQTEYGDKFLASQASARVSEKVKYNGEIFPKVVTFERDFWIMELYEQMKKGMIRFPLGSYEQVSWLMQHCSNMEIKPSISRTGDVSPHYIKSGPNDGFMALLNAYIAYKFYLTKGFQVKNPLLQEDIGKKKPQASVIAVYSPR